MRMEATKRYGIKMQPSDYIIRITLMMNMLRLGKLSNI